MCSEVHKPHRHTARPSEGNSCSIRDSLRDVCTYYYIHYLSVFFYIYLETP